MPKLNDDSAIVQDKTIYGKKTKAVPKPEKSIGIDTKKQILDNIYQAGEVGQIDMSSIENFSRMADNREQIYQLLIENYPLYHHLQQLFLCYPMFD